MQCLHKVEQDFLLGGWAGKCCDKNQESNPGQTACNEEKPIAYDSGVAATFTALANSDVAWCACTAENVCCCFFMLLLFCFSREKKRGGGCLLVDGKVEKVRTRSIILLPTRNQYYSFRLTVISRISSCRTEVVGVAEAIGASMGRGIAAVSAYPVAFYE